MSKEINPMSKVADKILESIEKQNLWDLEFYLNQADSLLASGVQFTDNLENNSSEFNELLSRARDLMNLSNKMEKEKPETKIVVVESESYRNNLINQVVSHPNTHARMRLRS